MNKNLRLIISGILLIIILIAAFFFFTRDEVSAPTTTPQTITVFAAASLTDAFTAIGEAFSTQNEDITVQFNFGSSSSLATQLAEGAPADVFASANNTQMQVAIDAGRIAEPVQTFAGNGLVVIVHNSQAETITSLADLANEGIVFVLAAEGVPIRDYAESMLALMSATEDYGADYGECVLANLVSNEADVRQATAKVAMGEADVSIVYSSDVTPDVAPNVTIIPVPSEFNVLAPYPIAVTDNASVEAANAFINFVLSDAGQAILTEWGFLSADALATD
jgi:molybdate transport system substrate-binding protein